MQCVIRYCKSALPSSACRKRMIDLRKKNAVASANNDVAGEGLRGIYGSRKLVCGKELFIENNNDKKLLEEANSGSTMEGKN